MKTINFCYGCDVFGKRDFSGDDYEDSVIIPDEKSSCPYCYVRYKMFPARGLSDFTFFKPSVFAETIGEHMKSKTSEIFIGSIMGDFLSPSIPDEDICEVIEKISEFPNHIMFLLSKNSARYYKFLRDVWKRELPGNIIIGTSIENERYAYRADHLRKCLEISPSTRLWIEIEPLLGFHHNTDFSCIEYVSCSCLGDDQIYYQSGKRFPWVFKEEWMQSIIDNPTLNKENLSIYHNIKNLCSSEEIREWENPNLYKRYFHREKSEITLW